MALGTSDKQRRFDDPVAVLVIVLKDGSIYKLLAEHGHEMFPDDYFADCYSNSREGRPTVPARILATVMILQAFEGLSDREATDRLGFDLRWQAAAGVSIGAEAFHPTVLVGPASTAGIFSTTTAVRRHQGRRQASAHLCQRARVLDSTPVYDAVATEDTVHPAAGLAAKAASSLDQTDQLLAREVRAALHVMTTTRPPEQPPCDWDDRAAARCSSMPLSIDCHAALDVLANHELKGSRCRR